MGYKFRLYHLFYCNNINLKIHHIPGNHDVGIDPNNLSMKGLEFYKKNFGNDFYNFNWKGFELIFLNGSKFINYQNSNIYKYSKSATPAKNHQNDVQNDCQSWIQVRFI